jgi:hypothetical protein
MKLRMLISIPAPTIVAIVIFVVRSGRADIVRKGDRNGWREKLKAFEGERKGNSWKSNYDRSTLYRRE